MTNSTPKLERPKWTRKSAAHQVRPVYQVRSVHQVRSAYPVPKDAQRLIAKWELLGRPAIDLQPGVSISNLERWLNHWPAPQAHLGRVREYLYVDDSALPL